MFHHAEKNVDRRQCVISVNQEITRAINKYLSENYERMSMELQARGVPVEKIDAIIQEVKWEAQVAAIKRFKEKLQAVVEQAATKTATVPCDQKTTH